MKIFKLMALVLAISISILLFAGCAETPTSNSSRADSVIEETQIEDVTTAATTSISTATATTSVSQTSVGQTSVSKTSVSTSAGSKKANVATGKGKAIDDTDIGTGLNQITYSMDMGIATGAHFYKGSNHYTWEKAFYQFKFKGTQFEIYGSGENFFGLSQVTIDGKIAGTINQFSPAKITNQPIFVSDVLANAVHTVKVTNLKQVPSGSAGTCFDVDKIIVR